MIEFLDPNSDLSKNISKEYWVKVDREKPKYLPSQVVEKVKVAGFPDFITPENIINKTKWKIKKKFVFYLHKSLCKEIFILKKT